MFAIEESASAHDDGENWVDTPPGMGWFFTEFGTYTYSKRSDSAADWAPTGVTERYSEFVSSDGSRRRIRAHRDAHSMPKGVGLKVEALMEFEDFIRLEFQLNSDDGMAVSKTRYEIDGQSLLVHREGVDSGDELESVTIPDEGVYLPLTRNFMGPVITEVADGPDGQAPVVVPDLRDPSSSTVFSPLIGTRAAARSEGESVSVFSAARNWETVHYTFEGGPYDGRSSFWLCSRTHRLIRYEFVTSSGEEWSAELVELVLEGGSELRS